MRVGRENETVKVRGGDERQPIILFIFDDATAKSDRKNEPTLLGFSSLLLMDLDGLWYSTNHPNSEVPSSGQATLFSPFVQIKSSLFVIPFSQLTA